MFRVLSSEESHKVKKWQAPSLSDSDEMTISPAGIALREFDDEDAATTDIAHLQHVVRNAKTNALASNDDFTGELGEPTVERGSHASLEMLNPSADMLQQTYDEGYAAGVESGKSEVNSAAADTLASLLNSLAPQKYQIDADVELEVVSLAKAIAKMILKREVVTDDEVMLEIVRCALAQIPMTAETPTVVLNPVDLSIVQNMQTTPVLADLISDSSMTRGDCRIELGASILEAGVDALVASISSTSSQPIQDQTDAEQVHSVDDKTVEQ